MLNAKDYPHVTKRGNGQLPMYRCFYIILYNDHLHQQAKTWGGGNSTMVDLPIKT